MQLLCTCVIEEGNDGEGAGSKTLSLLGYILYHYYVCLLLLSSTSTSNFPANFFSDFPKNKFVFLKIASQETKNDAQLWGAHASSRNIGGSGFGASVSLTSNCRVTRPSAQYRNSPFIKAIQKVQNLLLCAVCVVRQSSAVSVLCWTANGHVYCLKIKARLCFLLMAMGSPFLSDDGAGNASLHLDAAARHCAHFSAASGCARWQGRKGARGELFIFKIITPHIQHISGQIDLY